MYLIKLIRDQLRATFYRRPFYDKMREIIGEHRSARHRRLYALDFVIFFYTQRMLWIAYLMYVDFAAIQRDTLDAAMRYDVTLAFLYTNRRTFPPIFVFVLYIFHACVWISHILLWRIDPRTMTWRWWYELVVESQDAYRAAAAAVPSEVIAERRRQFELKYSGPGTRIRAPAVFRSNVARLRVWWTFSNVDQRQLFAERPLTALPNLSHRLRRKIMRFLAIVDNVTFLFQPIIVLLFAVTLFDMARKENTIEFTPFARMLIIVEIYFVHYCFQRMIHLVIFFTSCSILGTMVYTGRVIEVTRPVDALVSRFCRRRQKQNREEGSNFRLKAIESGEQQQQQQILSYRKYGALISRQIADHNKVSYLVLRGCDELFGSVMFMFVFTNLPLNIYLIRQIWFSRSDKSVEQIIVIIIFVLQTLITIIGMVPLAWCCGIYHSPKRFIPRLQAITGKSKWLRLKLRYDDLYGRLMSGPKIGLTIGPMDAITYNSVFEFVLIYVAYLLMAFSQQIEADMERSEATIAKLTKNLNKIGKN